MSKENKQATDKTTDITMILDRSGSMGHIQEQVIRSFNGFLHEQKAVQGKALISLFQFDDQYEVNYQGVDMQDANELNAQTYQPRGMTALNDAIGRTIVSMKKRLKETKANVVVVITTDGLENASKEFTRTQIREMIQECEEKLGWKFMYLAADDASFEEYEGIGMDHRRSFKTGKGQRGYENAVNVMSGKMSLFRRTGIEYDLGFSEQERQEASDIGDE
jgi:hypothetical protein